MQTPNPEAAPPQAKAPAATPQRAGEPRPPLSLPEVLELLRDAELLTAQQSKEIEARAVTLRSRVLKDKVGSVRGNALSVAQDGRAWSKHVPNCRHRGFSLAILDEADHRIRQHHGENHPGIDPVLQGPGYRG